MMQPIKSQSVKVGSQYLALKKLTGSPTIITQAAKHNLREIQKELGANSHINPTKTPQNLILAGADSAAAIAAMFRDTLQACGIVKLRKNVVHAVECVIGIPAKSDIEPEIFFRESLQWVRDYFKCPVISAVVHLDESAPHCHFLLVPLIDGRMNGSDLVGSRGKLIQTQQDFNAAVGARYGLKRNEVVKMSKALRYSAASLALATISKEPDWLNEPNLRLALQEVIAANPVAILEALAIEMPAAHSKTFVEIMTRPAPEKRIH